MFSVISTRKDLAKILEATTSSSTSHLLPLRCRFHLWCSLVYGYDSKVSVLEVGIV